MSTLGTFILLVLITAATCTPFWFKKRLEKDYLIKLERDYLIFYFLGVLLFAMVYSVGFLNFRIGGIVSLEKVAEIRREKELILTLLAISVDNNSRIGFLGLDKSYKELMRDRERLVKSLRETGTNDSVVLQIIRPLNEQIIKVYASDLSQKIRNEFNKISKEGKINGVQESAGNNKISEIFKISQRSPVELTDIEKIQEVLKENEIVSDEIQFDLNEMKVLISQFEKLNDI